MSWSSNIFTNYIWTSYPSAPWWYRESGTDPGSPQPFWEEFITSMYPDDPESGLELDWADGSYYMRYPTIKWLVDHGKFTSALPTDSSRYLEVIQYSSYSFLPPIEEVGTTHTGFLNYVHAFGGDFSRKVQYIRQWRGHTDFYDGAPTMVEGVNCSYNTSDLIEFFSNNYSTAPFVCFQTKATLRGALDEDGDLVEVLFNHQVQPLDAKGSPGLNSSGEFVYANNRDDITDEQEEAKFLPKPISSTSMTTIEGMIGTATSPFIIPLTYKLETYPDIKADLRSRFKIPSIINQKRDEYVEQRVTAYTNVLRETLLIPKEYRVRRQRAPDFANEQISAFSTGEMAEPVTSSPPSSGAGGGGGTMGGGY